MSGNKTVRKVTDLKEQQLETYRYWQTRTAAERMEAVAEIVRSAYLAKGIDISKRQSDKTLRHVARPDWKAV